MAPATLDVSVVICAYTEDRWADLVAAVASVQRQMPLLGEIIVVIDHNPDLLVHNPAAVFAVVVCFLGWMRWGAWGQP
jgi:hypothetical protein